MALILRELALELEDDESSLVDRLAARFSLRRSDILEWQIVRRGIDARKKPRVLRVYTVRFRVEDERALLQRGDRHLDRAEAPQLPFARPLGRSHRVLVVGMGPAGLFAALRLAQYGLSVTLAERGRPVEARVLDVRRFWSGEGLDPESNVQFGEGGAGTFSDGKLTTRVNHPWMRLVLQTLVDCGAPEDILVQAKPHVGSDRLRLVLINLRRKLQELGVDIRFETRLTGFESSAGRIRAGVLDGREAVDCDSLVLAPGHSARDTYSMLAAAGVTLQAKAFAVGYRVEHPVEIINTIQYGFPRHPRLPAAEYALTFNDPATGRGVYSFCMCPGGEVINAASEPGAVVVNGMSLAKRDGTHSNSALVVSVRPDDFPGERDALAGVRFQRQWEEEAFRAAGGDFRVPAQGLLAFLGRKGGAVHPVCKPGIREADLARVLPAFVSESLRRALPHFERRMRGFITSEASLLGVETRTSAPLRILRGEDGQSVSHAGLYPAGEGAGYAGGIMSAALDGLKTAEHVAAKAGGEAVAAPG